MFRHFSRDLPVMDALNASGELLLDYPEEIFNTNTSVGDHETTEATFRHIDPDAQRDSLYIVVPMSIIYSLIFVTGVIGNISTCLVIKKNRSMHTATNYYLFSLAISDFLLLLSGVPQEMYFIWSKHVYVFGEYFCIGRGIIAESSANATVLTITAFSVERYLAICHPFFGQGMSKLNRAIRIIILIWVLAVLAAVPQAAQFGIITADNGVEKCTVVRVIQHSFQLSTFIFFFAPMSIILVLYLLIGLHLYRSNVIGGPGIEVNSSRNSAQESHRPSLDSERRRRSLLSHNISASLRANSVNGAIATTCFIGGGTGSGGIHHDTALYRYSGGTQLSAVRGRLNQYGTRRVLKMLVAVVICFFLCWAPFHAQRLIAIYGSPPKTPVDDEAGNEISDHHQVIYAIMTYISGVLYYLSTCINPLLYNLMSHKFREAFKSILFRKKSDSSLRSRHTQESQRLRRNATLTSTTQREISDSEIQPKSSLVQSMQFERKASKQLA